MRELLDPILVAHVGHWVEWVLYAVPVVAVLIAILVSAYRGRGLEREEPNDSS